MTQARIVSNGRRLPPWEAARLSFELAEKERRAKLQRADTVALEVNRQRLAELKARLGDA